MHRQLFLPPSDVNCRKQCSGAVRLDDLQGLHFLTVLHSRLIFAAPAPLHRSEEDSFKLELSSNYI